METTKKQGRVHFSDQQQLAFMIELIFNQSAPSELTLKNAGQFGFLHFLEIRNISLLTVEEIEILICQDGKILHRFPTNMSKYLHESFQVVNREFEESIEKYDGHQKWFILKRNCYKIFEAFRGRPHYSVK